jgi:hypothetical protein
MSSTQTISPEINELFEAVNDEVTWLHTVWELLNQLYWSGAENFEIMEATAPHFFGILRTILFEEMVMIVNRLTDRPITSGRPNASLERLIGLLDSHVNANLVASLQNRLKSMRTKHDTFRIWRDKKVSHNDLSNTLDKGNSLPHIMRGQAQTLVKEMADFMNELSMAIYDKSQSYMPFLVANGDGNALMQYLKLALKGREEA